MLSLATSLLLALAVFDWSPNTVSIVALSQNKKVYKVDKEDVAELRKLWKSRDRSRGVGDELKEALPEKLSSKLISRLRSHTFQMMLDYAPTNKSITSFNLTVRDQEAFQAELAKVTEDIKRKTSNARLAFGKWVVKPALPDSFNIDEAVGEPIDGIDLFKYVAPPLGYEVDATPTAFLSNIKVQQALKLTIGQAKRLAAAKQLLIKQGLITEDENDFGEMNFENAEECLRLNDQVYNACSSILDKEQKQTFDRILAQSSLLFDPDTAFVSLQRLGLDQRRIKHKNKEFLRRADPNTGYRTKRAIEGYIKIPLLAQLVEKHVEERAKVKELTKTIYPPSGVDYRVFAESTGFANSQSAASRNSNPRRER